LAYEFFKSSEHFLDLVNADFSDDAEVDKILDTWEEVRPESGSSYHGTKFDEDEGQSGVTVLKRAPLRKEIPIIFRRAIALIIRDPILYVGRCIVFLFANTIFSLVYLKARNYDQSQAINKMWINVWHMGVAANLGAVAVYALNDEFKTIVREAKNGMIGPLTHALAKSMLVLPIMFVFAIVALGIPSILIMDFPATAFGKVILLWSMVMYHTECVAECISVWVDDPIIGMLTYMMYFFAFFLFSGFLISEHDLVWPFRAFYYITPFSYYIRSVVYVYLIDTTWSECDPNNNYENSAVCVTPPSGKNVLGGIHLVYPVIEAKDTFAEDIGVIIVIALFYKIFYVVGVYVKTSKSAKTCPNSDYRMPVPSIPGAVSPSRTKGETVKYAQDEDEEVTDFETEICPNSDYRVPIPSIPGDVSPSRATSETVKYAQDEDEEITDYETELALTQTAVKPSSTVQDNRIELKPLKEGRLDI
jgi:hypothetical protein